MNALLDAIGAVAVGGMILLSVMSGMYNIQVYSHNTKLQSTLTSTSEIAATAMQDRYLSALGLIPSGILASIDPDSLIVAASRKTFQFYAEIDGSVQLISIQQGTINGAGMYPLTAQVGGNLDFGPFNTSVENIFHFFDENNNAINFASNSIPNGQIKNIRSVRVDISFALQGLSQLTGGNRNLMNKIVFWQYFKNIYLLQA
jgi:hypothetical protein